MVTASHVYRRAIDGAPLERQVFARRQQLAVVGRAIWAR